MIMMGQLVFCGILDEERRLLRCDVVYKKVHMRSVIGHRAPR